VTQNRSEVWRLVPVLLAASLLAGCPGKPKQTAKADNRAPDFTLTALDGASMTLSSLQGKPVVIDFWGSWCPPCLQSMNDMVPLSERFHGRVAFLGVALNDTKADVARIQQEKMVSYPLLLGTDQVAKAYQIAGVPTIVVLDREGKIVSRESGWDPDSALKPLERVLNKLVGGKGVQR
jgi:thiol-disulfide isomerase/thioredoxin